MAEVPIPPTKRIAVVTGGNKGIGLEICRQLACNGVTVILTARDEKRGNEAVQKLKASGLADVVFHRLDVMDPATIPSLADFLKTQFGKLDILVNNAGVSGIIMDGEAFTRLNLKTGEFIGEKAHLVKEIVKQTNETAEECLRTNFHGTKQVTQQLLPLLHLSNSARIVNVSSNMSKLKMIPNEMAKELGEIERLTVEKIEEVVEGYLEDAKQDKLEAKGWSMNSSAYLLSKVAVNAYTRILARKFPNMCINAVSPGFVKTDLSFNNGEFTVEEGARGPVMLALLPHGGPSGLFFYQMEQSTF